MSRNCHPDKHASNPELIAKAEDQFTKIKKAHDSKYINISLHIHVIKNQLVKTGSFLTSYTYILENFFTFLVSLQFILSIKENICNISANIMNFEYFSW